MQIYIELLGIMMIYIMWILLHLHTNLCQMIKLIKNNFEFYFEIPEILEILWNRVEF